MHHQTGYINKVLEKFKMKNSRPANTPLPSVCKLSLMDCPEEVDPRMQRKYREIIGSLMCLYQLIRPDLGFTVTFLSRYLHKPSEKHMQAAKHALR